MLRNSVGVDADYLSTGEDVMPHWRAQSQLPSRQMILWIRSIMVLCGVLIGCGLALLVWGLA